MSARIAVGQVLRWSLRGATRSVSNPIVTCGYHHHVRKASTTRGVRCSELAQTGAAAFPIPPSRSGELCPRSLLDMGFTDAQAEQVGEAVGRCPGGGGDAAVSTLMALFVLGLNPSSVVKVLEKCPEILCVKGELLQQRIGNLRKLGLLEGGLQRVVSHYPQILTVPPKRVNGAVRFLRERCLFTSQQVTDVLRDCPSVVQEDRDRLEYRFQYAYFRMGVKQAEQVKSRLFRVDLSELRCRHGFLERRGLYETPDKKGQTRLLNPKMADVLGADEEAFLSEVAMATAEEYGVFRRLMAREWQEEERRGGDDDDDDEEEEEEEEGGKAGYQKRRKR